ncbi:MAG: DUF5665 domain-containing protein [Patescibacteria group bacterium]
MDIKVVPEQPFERTITRISIKEILFNNFIGGIAWGFGATVGISVLFTILGIIADQANLVPIIGSFVSDITTFVLNNNQDLRK